VDDRSSPEPLHFEIRINATREEVFPYLTDSRLVAQWLGTTADIQPEPGGQFAIDFDDTKSRGHFITVEAPQRVVFTWGIPGSEELPAGSTTVEITLTPDGDGTIVRLIHHGVPASLREGHEEGWIACLDKLSHTVGR
jgi:uncharacterized protein YndB with AHSA1/START domain